MDLNDTLPAVNSATPPKPITSPALRQLPSRSWKTKWANSAANSGAVALRTANNPAVRCCAAKPNNRNGSAVNGTACTTSATGCARNCPKPPRHTSKGNSTATAMAMRKAISGAGPNAGTAARMNR